MQKYKLNVLSCKCSQAELVKALRPIGRMSLKKAELVANALFERTPITLIAGLDLNACEVIQENLNISGLLTEILSTDIQSPLLVDTSIEYQYEWSALRRLKKIEQPS